MFGPRSEWSARPSAWPNASPTPTGVAVDAITSWLDMVRSDPLSARSNARTLPEETQMIRTYRDVTPAVLKVMEQTTDPHLREIMTALVRHLHGFIVETCLTETEFRTATAILAEMGRLTTATHQEFVLMAGSLGVSSLVCLLNNGDQGRLETSQNLLGPFWRMHSPRVENGGSIVRSDTPGSPLFVKAKVIDREGGPVAGAEVDVWHASPAGLYESQDPDQADMNLRGKLTTDARGRFWFRSVMMAGYPIPTDGVVGRLLKAQNRRPFRPAHLHALIVKEGFKVLISQVYNSADSHIDDDAQFGVTQATLGDFARHDEDHPSARDVAGPWYSLDCTYVLERGQTVLPEPPIK
jgi:catechol 1,2-dioxygenase